MTRPNRPSDLARGRGDDDDFDLQTLNFVWHKLSSKHTLIQCEYCKDWHMSDIGMVELKVKGKEEKVRHCYRCHDMCIYCNMEYSQSEKEDHRDCDEKMERELENQ